MINSNQKICFSNSDYQTFAAYRYLTISEAIEVINHGTTMVTKHSRKVMTFAS